MADVTGFRPIRRLLVANRGEIARRIFRTARDMGISTVAVYAEGDARAPFVAEADHAVALGGRSSAETYLDVSKLIDACRASGADAVHPGYGFLSENAGFAQAVIDAGLVWIGPSPRVIGLMGDKLSAKKLMAEAGVPTLPAAEISKKQNLRKAAREIGYPVLVKASAGGGGRGMRVVESETDLESAVESARREAGASFGDDTVFLERWLQKTRHVEIQILGDLHGNLVHCFERECSIQRRHQKIIEEAPSPSLREPVRQKMCEAAVTAARRLGYASAGTVEFLLAGDEFWFLEVNARLQVEHPVTEAVIGRDLVREQILIAEGEPLSFGQEDLSVRGWAIEARLCAEDPQNDFLPSPGEISAWDTRACGQVRVDSGVEQGDVVSPDFDAMIAKLIAHAPTRREAAARLARALEGLRIQGLTTNRDFLAATLQTPEFLAGDTTTDFIARVKPSTRRLRPRDELVAAAIAAAIESQAARRACALVLKGLPSGWRNTPMPRETVSFSCEGAEIVLAYQRMRDGVFEFLADGNEHRVRVYGSGAGRIDIAIDARRLRYAALRRGSLLFLHGAAGDLELCEMARYPEPAVDGAAGSLTAPMPGQVRAVLVAPGEAVTRGQVLMVLEAMKMEHRIAAPRDAVVSSISAAMGDQVRNGQLLLTLAEPAPKE